jgi:hypothetical protein
MTQIGSQTVSEGETLGFQVFGQDPDGDSLTFSAENLPEGASFNPTTHIFTWSPTYAQSGNYDVKFAVTDGQLSASEVVLITVNNVNRAPTLDPIGPHSVDEGATLTITVTGQDLDGDALPSPRRTSHRGPRLIPRPLAGAQSVARRANIT